VQLVSNLIDGAVLEHHGPELHRELPERGIKRSQAVANIRT
jgi:hypothetical protein